MAQKVVSNVVTQMGNQMTAATEQNGQNDQPQPES
jgi:hypothetical protein